jgi:TPR repeat protein
MFNLGRSIDMGEGVGPPDYPAAADWYRRAADAGICHAANNLSVMYSVGRGKAWQILPTSSSSTCYTLATRLTLHQLLPASFSSTCYTLVT